MVIVFESLSIFRDLLYACVHVSVGIHALICAKCVYLSM